MPSPPPGRAGGMRGAVATATCPRPRCRSAERAPEAAAAAGQPEPPPGAGIVAKGRPPSRAEGELGYPRLGVGGAGAPWTVAWRIPN